ncbi:quinon protein alcohol dehydrogenase-like superfamily [Dimargaris cristalligena]|uniref:Quinon protein alcohol dehydrogenase-like superfamily n=1 Tax=Dimargaris cristalligena TaxID=215637 RepID=A0A4P9ZQ32_9FUNG|nr:quinon protein alcohol dehydrogenase-like superfamily [Dimargaris cristalligena]|eukprot:RKP35576.1 quinon protein alcohol dehydrogenase-like superfamily [Dimargaris cristalligena]
MPKTYLRYEAAGAFGVVASARGNAVFDQTGKLIISPALEKVNVWNAKKGTLEHQWEDPVNKAEVTALCRSPNGTQYAVGYADGAIRIYDLRSGALVVTFNGHRSAVSSLCFDRSGATLVSGARDTHIILWNVLSETGICRMMGHKDEVTVVQFLYSTVGAAKGQATHLISASKDTLVKLWDLDTQHCVHTLVHHRSEVWAMAINPAQTLLVTGSSDKNLRVWKLHCDRLDRVMDVADQALSATVDPVAAGFEHPVFEFYGELARQSTDRVVQLQFDPLGFYLACLPNHRQIEIFRLYNHADIRKKQTRRLKHKRAKAKKTGDTAEPVPDPTDDTIPLDDEIRSYQVLHSTTKILSFDFPSLSPPNQISDIQMAVQTNDNRLQVYQITNPDKVKVDTEGMAPSVQHSIELAGHRREVLAVALSSNDELLASAAQDSLKIWNTSTRTCIRTMECGAALCCEFLPGNKHVVVGTRSGELQLFDISSSTLLESIPAHSKEIRTLAVQPDRRGLATGSADHVVKFWEFELAQTTLDDDEGTSTGLVPNEQVTLAHVRTLEMDQSVLSLRFSADMKFLAVALLDSTIKMFFADSLKYHLSLYGHKLPVTAMDISDDGTLLISGSSDKNIKIWGTDFGDCHKSIFAHQDTVTALRFVPHTHYFFSAGKDRVVKYWDADKFNQIMKLEGHHSEVWALSVSRYGNWVVASGRDRSIRMWERTEEPLFLEEEREREMDELYEANLVQDMERAQVSTDLENSAEGKAQAAETGRATRQTMESLKAGERIIEALELVEGERIAMETYEMMKDKGALAIPMPAKNPILLALGDISPERYLLSTLEKIRSSELEDALLILPFSSVTALFPYFDYWILKGWNTNLVCRMLFFLLQVHHQQITASRTLASRLAAVRQHLRTHLERQRDAMGFNIAGLKFLQEQHISNMTASYFDEAGIDSTLNYGMKKRKFITVAKQ